MTGLLADRLLGALGSPEILTEEPLLRAADSVAIGVLRTRAGGVVESRLAMDGLAGVMLHAFSDDARPHLVSDTVLAGGTLTVNVDLLPRVDLGVSPDWLEWYEALTPVRAAARALGEPLGDLPPRLHACGSPWLVAVRAGEEQAGGLGDALVAYARHRAGPVPASGPTRGDAPARRTMFDPASDPVWGLMENLLGTVTRDRILALLRGPTP